MYKLHVFIQKSQSIWLSLKTNKILIKKHESGFNLQEINWNKFVWLAQFNKSDMK